MGGMDVGALSTQTTKQTATVSWKQKRTAPLQPKTYWHPNQPKLGTLDISA